MFIYSFNIIYTCLKMMLEKKVDCPKCNSKTAYLTGCWTDQHIIRGLFVCTNPDCIHTRVMPVGYYTRGGE